jgi:hypothetical protein
MPGSTYYFLHIPKTAGTSVSTWIQAQAGIRFCPDNLWSQLLRRDREELDRFNFFVGHFYTGLAAYLCRELTTLSFLRHPVERSISHYLHVMREEDHYLHQRARILGSFTAFMRDPLCVPMIFNFQTRMLSMEFEPVDLQKKLNNPDNHPYALERQIESQLEGYASSVNLSRAMAYLDRCAFVGITELMEESLAELQRVLGATGNPGPPPELNVSGNKSGLPALTPDEYKELLTLLTDDLALYEYANRVFRRRPGQSHPR